MTDIKNDVKEKSVMPSLKQVCNNIFGNDDAKTLMIHTNNSVVIVNEDTFLSNSERKIPSLLTMITEVIKTLVRVHPYEEFIRDKRNEYNCMAKIEQLYAVVSIFFNLEKTMIGKLFADTIHTLPFSTRNCVGCAWSPNQMIEKKKNVYYPLAVVTYVSMQPSKCGEKKEKPVYFKPLLKIKYSMALSLNNDDEIYICLAKIINPGDWCAHGSIFDVFTEKPFFEGLQLLSEYKPMGEYKMDAHLCWLYRRVAKILLGSKAIKITDMKCLQRLRKMSKRASKLRPPVCENLKS